MSLNSLEERYQRECKERGLPAMCAYDLEAELIASMEGEPSKIGHMALEDKAEHVSWVRRFQSVHLRVAGEQRRIQILCIEALKHGYSLHSVDDGEEVTDMRDGSIEEVIEAAMAVDESSIVFRGRASGKKIRFFLVFGNSPEELIADHTDHPDAELIWQAVQARK